MDTKCFTLTNLSSPSYQNDVQNVANILKGGGLVAIPTETVYGLAANALDADAVAKIFIAKGRPSDNPLIVHISSLDMLPMITSKFPEMGYKLAQAFWGGPLTIIVPKCPSVPTITSGGLDSVAIRMPSHQVALDIITASGVPIAAPSANPSGRPSPTTAQHCIDDLMGRIDAIVDGGSAAVGIESTVLSLLEDEPIILRPGFITPQQIKSVVGCCRIAEGVSSNAPLNQPILSPGMRYQHYSPIAEVKLIDANPTAFLNYVNSISNANSLVLTEDEHWMIHLPTFFIGTTSEEQAVHLFDALRQADRQGADCVYVRCPKPQGVGLALYNRLIRAAGHHIIHL